MRKITADQFRNILADVGLEPGDGVMVHSAIQYLGLPVGGLDMYLDVLRETVGHSGTIIVPAFYNDFVRTRRFSPLNTPAERAVGVFSEFVRCQPEAKRSHHPIQSVAVIGARAADLAGRDTPSAFEAGSSFARMLELDFKVLFLGGRELAATVLHISEQDECVPYRHWMDFPGEFCIDGRWQQRAYRIYVRRKEIDAHIDFDRIGQWLKVAGKVSSRSHNSGTISLCRMADYVGILNEKLDHDPWALVGNREEAIARYRNAVG